jgi:hypothetical protein
MSQHNIEMKSPKLGHVQVTIGFDLSLNESFLNFYNDQATYQSPAGTAASELQDLSVKELGMRLPQQLLDALQEDIADLRLGATDVGRRIRVYNPDGALSNSVTY